MLAALGAALRRDAIAVQLAAGRGCVHARISAGVSERSRRGSRCAPAAEAAAVSAVPLINRRRAVFRAGAQSPEAVEAPAVCERQAEFLRQHGAPPPSDIRGGRLRQRSSGSSLWEPRATLMRSTCVCERLQGDLGLRYEARIVSPFHV